ncbi:MAG: HAD-IA family hydrolase [Draconibacterium sp.]|nr:HAD-IA family hydrolase [Draconibacterium sp.]
MSRFSHIIFDLDGTLTDNTVGISNSIKHALKQMQIDGYSENILDQFIGPPLQMGFKNVFNMSEKEIELAIEYFREYYRENGWRENLLYPGVLEMLEALDQTGVKMYIATAKYEKFAKKIIEYFELDKYIIQLNGADYSGKKAIKTIIISNLMESQQLVPSKEIVMVGDTIYDIVGGKENGLATIALKYGFGKEADIQKAEPDYFVENVNELYEILVS